MENSGIRKVGVIGISLMGSGIAQVAATQGFDTGVVDVSAEIVEKGMERIKGSLQRLAESHEKTEGKSGIPAGERDKALARLRGSTERRELLDRDIVIEAMVENEAAKLVAAGSYGMKNGKGFYLWDKGKKTGVNPAVERYRRK